MAQKKNSLTKLIPFAVIVLVVVGVMAYIVLSPGTTYLVHVTVVNNAPAVGAHSDLYIGYNIYSPGNGNNQQIDQKYWIMSGHTNKFDVSDKVSPGSNATLSFDAVDSGRRLDTITYTPTKNESSVTIAWDGSKLSIQSVS